MVDEIWQIIGIVVSFLGIFISIFLVLYIRHLDGKQRERDELFYITITMRYIKQLKEHMIAIQMISEHDGTIPSDDEKVEKVGELMIYTKKNKQLITQLVSDIRFSMSRWMSLKDMERNNVEEFITTINWTLDNYLPKLDENEATQIRRWSNSYDEFYKRKTSSSNKMNELISKYT